MTRTKTSDALESLVRSTLNDRRWNHTQGVRAVSGQLSNRYEIPSDQLDRAALLHDIAKGFAGRTQQSLAERYRKGLDNIEDVSPGLWHGPAGAQYLKSETTYTLNSDVLTAIAEHTTGIAEPSSILKGLMIADFSEPNRSYSEAHEVRSSIGSIALDELARIVLRKKIEIVMSRGDQVHPRSLETYNSLCV